MTDPSMTDAEMDKKFNAWVDDPEASTDHELVYWGFLNRMEWYIPRGHIHNALDIAYDTIDTLKGRYENALGEWVSLSDEVERLRARVAELEAEDGYW